MKRFKDFIKLNETKISFEEFKEKYGDDVRDIYWTNSDKGLIDDEFTEDDAIEKAYKEYLNENLNNNFVNDLINDIKNYLISEDEYDYDTWEEFIDNQENGDCQNIVSSIVYKFPQVKKVFGEIEVDEPYIDKYDEEQNLMTHHWVREQFNKS